MLFRAPCCAAPDLRQWLLCAACVAKSAAVPVLGGCASCATSRVVYAAANMMPPPTASRTNLSSRGTRITRLPASRAHFRFACDVPINLPPHACCWHRCAHAPANALAVGTSWGRGDAGSVACCLRAAEGARLHVPLHVFVLDDRVHACIELY